MDLTQLDVFVKDLLHIDEGTKNKLVDLGAGDKKKTFFLSHRLHPDLSAYLIGLALSHTGSVGNTVMRGSARVASDGKEQVLGGYNDVDWADANGERDPDRLQTFIEDLYKEIRTKGNNPLFLSVGALRWKISVTSTGHREVLTPILLFPVRLIRSGDKSIPVYIEFVNDDVILNPCLIAKLRQVWGNSVADSFPLPEGCSSEDDPVDLQKLGDGSFYFTVLEKYAEHLREGGENTLFQIERNVSAIAEYRHDEICAYYDIRRNRDKIERSELVGRIFSERYLEGIQTQEKTTAPVCILPRDSAQEDMISLAVRGESFIVKGPPGTGKTLTIANMIAALLAEGKHVVFSSKKLSALSEVYGKLPERLRPFVMLLDGETETQTARTDPMEIKRELKDLLERRGGYVRSDEEIYGARARGLKGISDGLNTLTEYHNRLFADEYLGGSYYHALDVLCKFDMTPVPLPADKVLSMDNIRYAAEKGSISDAGAQFDRLTRGKTIPIGHNPWYSLDPLPEDESGAFNDLRAISDLLTEGGSIAMKAFAEFGIDGGEVPVRTLALVSPLPDDTVRTLLIDRDISALEHLLSLEVPKCEPREVPKEVDAGQLALELLACEADGSLTLEEAKLLSKNRDALSNISTPEAVKAFRGAADTLQKLQAEEEKLLERAGAIFRMPMDKEREARVLKAAPHLAKYAGADKPKLLDFMAKKDFKDLSQFTNFSGATFREIVDAAVALQDARSLKNGQINKIRGVFSRLLRCDFNEELSACVALLVPKEDPAAHVLSAYKSCGLLERAATPVKGENLSLDELRALYRYEQLSREIKGELKKLAETSSFTLPAWGRAEAEAILSDYAFLRIPAIAPLDGERKCALAKSLLAAAPTLRSACDLLSAFGRTRFSNRYACDSPELTLAEIPVFSELSADRGMLGAARRYFSLKEDELVSAFFAPFESGLSAEGHTFDELFEHAVYAIVCAAGAHTCGKLRNGLGQAVSDAIDEWRKGRETLEESNLAYLESLLMSSIEPKDPAFAFVEAQRGGADSLRKLFKQFPSALLKLKRCFILSPSSVSVLFGQEEYFRFDTVIIDEASQLEPTSALPVLMRSKQCILVGDEFQMPPIKHFTTTSEKKITTEDGEETVYEADISVLSLALRNRSFPVRELKCHYRSKTESLIAFSQEKYYPNMRTFPATVPFSENVGFRDRYIPNGRCVRGVNSAEAEEVVKLLNDHFNRYYSDGTLSESVGIVAFGEAQIEEIKSLVTKNRDLSDKIARAIHTFGDLEEKLVFFKTIETVQGQETDHLILSLTYGKNAEGKVVQSFGQMNRGSLGQCIFNVAVTRARSTVTVVHSVLAHEVTNENVSYIGSYLGYAEKFAKDGLSQFVSEEPALGFIRSMGEFLAENGVDRKRIVYNYGVTKGSVRIPIAILSEDGREAQFGVKCETPIPARQFLDENALFYESLKERGWNLYRLFAHDWVDNRAAEEKKLLAAVKKFVK